MEPHKEKVVVKPKNWPGCDSLPGCKKCKFPYLLVGCIRCRSELKPGKPGTCEIWPFIIISTVIILMICYLVYLLVFKKAFPGQ